MVYTHNKCKGKVFRRLREEFPDQNIKIKGCVKQCGACRETPMATIDKKRVTARDGNGLYRKILEAIDQASGKE